MGKGGLVLNLRIGAQVPGSFWPREGVFSPCLWQRLSSMRPAHVLTAGESTGLPLSPGSPGVHLVLGLVTSLKSAVWAGALSPQTALPGQCPLQGTLLPTQELLGGRAQAAEHQSHLEPRPRGSEWAAPEHVHINPQQAGCLLRRFLPPSGPQTWVRASTSPPSWQPTPTPCPPRTQDAVRHPLLALVQTPCGKLRSGGGGTCPRPQRVGRDVPGRCPGPCPVLS